MGLDMLLQLPINLNPTHTPTLSMTPLMDHNLMLQRPLMVLVTNKETTMLLFLMAESSTSPTQLMMLMDILPMSLMMEQLPSELVLALVLLEVELEFVQLIMPQLSQLLLFLPLLCQPQSFLMLFILPQLSPQELSPLGLESATLDNLLLMPWKLIEYCTKILI